ncbi:unnamed protein product [Choristocarpus tenellus]
MVYPSLPSSETRTPSNFIQSELPTTHAFVVGRPIEVADMARSGESLERRSTPSDNLGHVEEMEGVLRPYEGLDLGALRQGAEVRGIIETGEEKRSIRMGISEAKEREREEKRALEVAQLVAARRNVEGLAMPLHTGNRLEGAAVTGATSALMEGGEEEGTMWRTKVEEAIVKGGGKEEGKDQAEEGEEFKSGGYNFGEYESEYDKAGGYTISEYKSVYD